MDFLNDLMTPKLTQYGLIHDQWSVNWYAQDVGSHHNWVLTVHDDYVEVRDTREDSAVITSHLLEVASPDFFERLERDLKEIIEWLKR